ncbi:hypothetical protein RRG08_015748 [Elysia crispata]|uniref:Uncharacterized protein n=1 Tax=Elysia crispata TaxID=231223 RepID=A0AAE1D3S5_9GAST|nr:hypothetical protein RRG08_015748 [Elysia crispata]
MVCLYLEEIGHPGSDQVTEVAGPDRTAGLSLTRCLTTQASARQYREEKTKSQNSFRTESTARSQDRKPRTSQTERYSASHPRKSAGLV